MTQRTRDRVIASGEKMSVRLLSLALASRGLKAIPLMRTHSWRPMTISVKPIRWVVPTAYLSRFAAAS